MVRVTCRQCGKEFEAKLSAKFCSKECAARGRTGLNHPRWTRTEKECEWCGEKFWLQAWEVKRGRRFCSTKCMGQWRKENIKGGNHPNWNGGGEIVTRICKQCGKEFTITITQIRQGNDKVCSRECADLFRHKSAIRVCTQCDKEFKSRPSEKQGKRTFCSKECYQEWQKQNKAVCVCKQCNREFEVYTSRVKAGEGIFCSRECMGQWISKYQRGENHPRWGGPKIKLCKWCGKEFEVRWPSEVSWRRCCSKECQGKWLSQNKSGENSSQWRGGISFEPYGIEFNETLRQFVRERDEYMCAICKMSERGRNPSIHHIDYDKQNNDVSNLITLCCSCHAITNENREYWQRILSPLTQLLHRSVDFRVGGMLCPS